MVANDGYCIYHVNFLYCHNIFVKETGVDINRPNAETAERDEKGNILVAITATNEIWIDKEEWI